MSRGVGGAPVDGLRRDELEGAPGGGNLYVATISGPHHDEINGLGPGEVVIKP